MCDGERHHVGSKEKVESNCKSLFTLNSIAEFLQLPQEIKKDFFDTDVRYENGGTD